MTDKEFAVLWNRSSSVKDFRKKEGIKIAWTSYGSVLNKAVFLRKKGFKLKKMPIPGRPKGSKND